jgi:sporulation protein YlmC with PRC-barrel domain
MKLPLKSLYGHALGAKDGAIGHVKDAYFDDKTWAVRYLVADTGSWLDERQVLLPPHSFGKWDQANQSLEINLTRAQIEASPPADRHRPVSRQFESDYYAYYGWPTYWVGDGFGGIGVAPPVVPSPLRAAEKHHGHNQRDDVHLHSARAVKGYEVQATNGSIGKLTDFIVNARTWRITELVVETGHWYAGKEILIEASQAGRVSYDEAKISLELAWTALS